MTKKLMLVVFSILVFGCLAWAEDKAIYGTVSDSHCGVKHATANAAGAPCVEHCVSGGAKYILVSEGKVYQLDAQDKFKGMGGKAVKVMGSVNGDSITVTDVTVATPPSS